MKETNNKSVSNQYQKAKLLNLVKHQKQRFEINHQIAEVPKRK